MTATPNAFKIYIRLLHDCDIAMGPGKADLLEAIEQHGSLSAAAKAMDISYRRVWAMVESMNNGFREPLVTTAHGGAKGGGASVTPFGHEVLRLYRTLQTEANDLTLRHFEHIKPLMKAD